MNFIFKRWVYIVVLGGIAIGWIKSSNAQSVCTREEIISSIKENIYKFYLNEGLAKVMNDTIGSKFYPGDYDTTMNIDEFLFELTQDLRRVSKDQHITINSLAIIKQSTYTAGLNKKLKGKKSKRLIRNDKEKLNVINRLIEKQSLED